MSQFPGPASDWIPLAMQLISPAVSTALTIPPANVAGVPSKGYDYVGILIVQGDSIFLRSDGVAAVATTLGGVQLNSGDFRIVYGLPSLKAVRAIRLSGSSVLVVEFYYYRAPT